MSEKSSPLIGKSGDGMSFRCLDRLAQVGLRARSRTYQERVEDAEDAAAAKVVLAKNGPTISLDEARKNLGL